ncbi:Fusarisetin A cluster transcription factor fsa6 [Zalerion maritima]|uniref:Fusarisetin A cluster transcription factor fsa6 n=1 Tax=Zalerion maritima TaxID=339359 RepID=A0AAD5WSX4_9PEZI|nr:Fusarisetin A cluster transcription factor fsa6 [Zalerion maritima]
MVPPMANFTRPETLGSGSVDTGDRPTPVPAPAKRTRVLLSCGPCRHSKLKCDREEPCSQCVKKDRVSACEYSPRPEKKSRAKGMSARLQRLEGMVRTMVENGSLPPQAAPGKIKSHSSPGDINGPENMAQVVHGETTTFVGATHFMAVLDDIEDLKSFFDDSEDESGDSPASTDKASSNVEQLLLGMASPKSKTDLLYMLPEKKVMDRLIMRYFNSHSPSQHVIHRPTFTKQYNVFCRDPSSVHMHFLALLFMVIGAGIFFSMFAAPHEVDLDAGMSVLDRFNMYRRAAGWALIQGKYTQPGPMTLQPFILYVEAEFMVSRAAQMDCYLLTSILIRLMLKMGLHRDPDKLVNVSPFHGEMRRRYWHMALQVDALVSFHMGLPSMVAGIESDTQTPRNLLDEDFDEDSPALPPGRPLTDHTDMSYSIFKSGLVSVFSRIASMAHALSPPAYGQVMQIDAVLEEKWDSLPDFLRVKSMDECVANSPTQIIQRFGLASMYNKCRCVLHRIFLTVEAPLPEHAYSRKACVEGASKMLEYQYTIYHACLPGGILSQNGWFVSSLAVHDFLLAAIILFLIIQCESYGHPGWMPPNSNMPTKSQLLGLLRRSYLVWDKVSKHVPEVKKTAGVLKTIITKLGVDPSANDDLDFVDGDALLFLGSSSISRLTIAQNPSSSNVPMPTAPQPLRVPTPIQSNFGLMSLTGLENVSSDPTWMTLDDELDWRFFDNVISGSSAPAGSERQQHWPHQGPDPGEFSQMLGLGTPWQPQ